MKVKETYWEEILMENKDIKWVVDKEHRVIVCMLMNCGDIACKRIRKYCGSYPYHYDRYIINDKYVGMARCAPDDKWNEEYGKALALKRAKRKRGVAANLAVIRYYNQAKHDLDSLLEYGVHVEVK